MHQPRTRGKQKTLPLPREKITFKYQRQFGVVILCSDEREQRRAYDALAKGGYRCKVVTV